LIDCNKMVKINGKTVSLRKGFKRKVLATLVTGFFLGIGYGIFNQSSLGSDYEGTHEVRIEEMGQTLWDIAKRECPDEDTRKVIYDIEQENPGLEPGRLHLEDVVEVPNYN